MDWIETYTGKKFFPLDPRPDDVCIEDIAHSLAMQCRFNGHCKTFYSVAEHSVLVSKMLSTTGYGRTTQLYGLLHDAAEAYICDLPRPLKNLIGSYRPVEKKIQSTVWEAFNLPAPTEDDYAAVKNKDNLLLGYEGAILMPNTEGWACAAYPFPHKPAPPLGLPYNVAEQRFLALFKKLTTGVVNR